MEAEHEKNRKVWRLTAGRPLSSFGLLFCAPLGASIVSLATGLVRICFGIASHVLGTRDLNPIVLAVVILLAAGCGSEVPGSAQGPQEQEDSPAKEAPGSASVREEHPGVRADRADDGFMAAKESSGGDAGAADRIVGVRLRLFDGFERLLIVFGRQDGKPAGVPRWYVESPPEGGYVRVRFPDVTSTEVVDEDFVGSVLDELYVVRSRDGGIFADVFPTHAFRYRINEFPTSGQLAIDLRGTREELELPPTTGDKVVVLQPREAEEVDSPLVVQGYTLLPKGRVTVSLLGRDREVISSETARTFGGAGTYGLFETPLEYSGYDGLATLRVGSAKSGNGSFVGTETEVFLE